MIANRKKQTPPAPEPVEDTSKLIGYARVSTRDQDPETQIQALIAAGVKREDIYYETASGASKRRPQYDAMMKDLRDGDTLVLWKLDRLGRKTLQVLNTMQVLNERGVKVRSLTQQIDTSTPMGRAMVGMLAIFADMEREFGLERTAAGLARARAEGRAGGATARHTDEAILEYAKLGLKPGARAAKMSVPGFLKARDRARKRLQEKRDARAKRKR